MVHNLSKSQSKWAQLLRVLGREGSDAWISGMFYVTLLQAVLLYGSYTWTIFPHIEKTLGSFQHHATHILTGRKPKSRMDGTWDYPQMVEAMTEAGIYEVETYVARLHDKVAQFNATGKIMGPCLAAVQIPGEMVLKWWRDQEGLDLEEIRMADQMEDL